MQVKFNVIAGAAIAAVAMLSTAAQAQDMVVKIGHVGPVSGAQPTTARTTKTAPAWPSKS